MSHARGFPFRCLRYYYSYIPDAKGETGVEYSWSLPCFLSEWRVGFRLPLQPMPGLLANVAVYGGLAYAIGRWLSRRRLRIERGHCPFCNYDLCGDYSRRCSECGSTRDTRFVNEPTSPIT